MKFVVLLLCALGLLLAQQSGPDREGNFEMRFEPAVKLQSAVEVPFQITVNDALHKPLVDAKVTMQIEMTDHSHTKLFPAPATGTGVYVSKPVFPVAGDWNITVEARRDNKVSARTIQFSVAE